jgi:hypothetical protein
MAYTIAMNTTDKVIVKFRFRTPRMVYSVYFNGMLLTSGYDAQQLGEDYAKKYGVEWLLQDGDKFYSQKGLVK